MLDKPQFETKEALRGFLRSGGIDIEVFENASRITLDDLFLECRDQGIRFEIRDGRLYRVLPLVQLCPSDLKPRPPASSISETVKRFE